MSKKKIFLTFLVVVFAAVLMFAPAPVQAYQIYPNPNPPIGDIEVTASDAENNMGFENGAWFFNWGTLNIQSSGTLNNSGRLANYGTLNNSGTLTNSGTVPNSGLVNKGTLNNYGTLNNGNLSNEGTLDNYATLTIQYGGELINYWKLYNSSSGTLTNAGILNNTGLYLINDGTLNNGIENGGGWLSNRGVLENNGTLNNQYSSTLVNYERLNNFGTLTNYSGTLTNNSGGTLANWDTLTNQGLLDNYGKLINNGTLTNNSGGTLTSYGALDNYGTLNNRVARLNNWGTLDNYFLLRNSNTAMLYNYGTLNNDGMLWNDTSQSYLINTYGGKLNNYGSLNNGFDARLYNSGELNNLGTLTNWSGNLGNDGTLNNSGTLNNYKNIYNTGTVNNSGNLWNFDKLDNPGTLNNSGTLTNLGTLTNQWGGTLTNNSGGTLNNSGTLTNQWVATLTNQYGGTLNNSGTLTNNSGGTLDNNGTLNNSGTLTNDGILTGTLTGTYIQSAGQTINNGSMSQITIIIDGGNLSGSGNLSAVDEYIGFYGTGTLKQTGGTHTVSNGLRLGTYSDSSGTYELSGTGNLSAEFENIGVYGTGTFIQSGGTNWVFGVSGALSLGIYSGSSGSYELSGTGNLSTSYSEIIGYSGTGTFKQTGGTNTVTNNLILGYNSGGTGTFTQTGGTNTITNSLLVGNNSGGSGTYELSGTGNLSAMDEYIGLSGTGTFVQTGGTNTVSNGLRVGTNADSSGAYELSGTGNLTAKFETIGVYGTGIFKQTGGTNTITDTLSLGYYYGSTGTYNLSGGTLTATNIDLKGVLTVINVGGTFTQSGGSLNFNNFYQYGGSANFQDLYIGKNPGDSITFIQSGGTNTVSNGLRLGANSGTSGTYELSGTGNLTATFENIGAYGTGTFTQTGGTNSVTNTLFLGYYSGGSGTYELRGGRGFNEESYLSAGDSEIIGYSGTGTFKQIGGGNTVTNNLVLGYYSGSSGTYELSGTRQGGGISAMNEYIGFYGTGTFKQGGGGNIISNGLRLGTYSGSSGTYELSGDARTRDGTLWAAFETIGGYGTGTFKQTGGLNSVTTGSLSLGYYSGGSGTYELSGGSLWVGYSEAIGYSGTGTFKQTGGGNTITSYLVLGYQAGGSGTYELSGTGNLSTLTSEIIGYYGTGTFNQSGGTNTVTNTLYIAANPGSSGTYNLAGGTLNAGNIVNNDKFNYSGGNLNANITNNANFKLSGTGERVVNGTVTNTAAAMLEIYQTQARFSGNVTNYGTVKVTGSTVTFLGTYTEYGAYISDPSKTYFTNNLTIKSTGYLKGFLGDEFYISGDFINNSQNPLWDTENADLIFSGSGPHILQLSSLDQANKWDMLSLLDGVILNLSGGAGSELYVDEIVGGTNNIFNIGSNPITIYYDGGELTLPGQPVPEPATMILLGSGLIGLAGYGRKKFFKK
jgi:hypothetical protein